QDTAREINEINRKMAEYAIEQFQLEIEAYKLYSDTRLDEAIELTDELLKVELDRVTEIHKREKQLLRERLNARVISEQEYNNAVLKLNQQFFDERKALEDQFEQDQEARRNRRLAAAATDFENLL